jgi:hypothetical protein
MYAILLNNGYVTGYIPLVDVSQDELDLINHAIVEEPPIFREGHMCKYDGQGYIFEELPQPERQPDRVAQLEAELLQTQLALTELAEASEQEKTEMQLALAELAEIITGGV